MRAIPSKELSLFDSTCVIVGIILGAGIYEITPTVASCMNGWGGVLGIWLIGGLLALSGALCYAELATTYPNEGATIYTRPEPMENGLDIFLDGLSLLSFDQAI